jgi:hypothetical protein
MKEKLNVVQSEPVPVEIFKLTPDQVKILPEFLSARDQFNVTSKAKEDVAKLLNLPKWEGKKVNVQLVDGRGRPLAIVEVRHRDGYPVLPGWVNKLVALK